MSVALRRPRLHTVAAPAIPAADVVAPAAYVGLVTRAIAFGLDAALINGVAILTAALAVLTLSVVDVPKALDTFAVAAGAALYVLWGIGYFVTFWSTTGQTPGNRAMRIRVQASSGGRLRPRRGAPRLVRPPPAAGAPALWRAAAPAPPAVRRLPRDPGRRPPPRPAGLARADCRRRVAR